MPTLLEKIEANAASRLTLPPQRTPAQELARYKNFLKVESHRLKILHRAGSSGRDICQARAALLDVLLRYILESVHQNMPEAAKKNEPEIALIAIGGYGRAELNPHSDIDIMFLHDGAGISRGKVHPYLTALTDGLLYTLWDIGLKVGHSVRSLDECVQVANTDMQSKTSLIEARLITGDEELFKKFVKVVLAKCVVGHEKDYIEARLQDQAARRAKYGDSACMQEPNIKNGCGGLRDYQNLLWMTFFKYRTRSLSQLEEQEMMSAAERRQLEAAYDFILRARNELHYQLNRPGDVITRNLQPTIANYLGYTDRSPSRRLSAFMKDLYTHLRNIDLITRTVEQRLAILPKPALQLPSLRTLLRPRKKPVAEIVDGFKIENGEIQAGSSRVFRDQPRRLMRVFLHSQQRRAKLHPDLAQMIRNQLNLVTREFLMDSHVRDTFLEILNQRGNVASILRDMHEVGFLGKYIPEFGKLTCLVQHEFYHQYTADEHTLICIEKLDQIWDAKAAPFNNYTEIFQSLERPFILYLALLLHDAGKAYDSGNHSQVGKDLAMKVARRLVLDSAATQSLMLLIEEHLTMASISQRRDLEDPAVIQSFATLMRTAENLSMLTLHTFSDSQGTSNTLWNGFKDTLLLTLFHKASELLRGGTEFIRAEARERELIAAETRRLLPGHISEEEMSAHFTNMPARYFRVHPPREIGADLLLVHLFMHLQLAEEEKALVPVINWHHEPDRGYTAVKVCTWDRAGLFAKIAGSLSAAGLNILSAQIFTRDDGIVIDTFFVTDAKTGRLANREEREEFESLMEQVLTGGHVDFYEWIARKKGDRSVWTKLENERIETRVHFDNNSSKDYTILEIETEDRVGLLYAISQTLTELRLYVSVAKICTEKGAALDSFYITEADFSKITDPERQESIEARLRAGIILLDEPLKPA